jgi:hypothetical protein
VPRSSRIPYSDASSSALTGAITISAVTSALTVRSPRFGGGVDDDVVVLATDRFDHVGEKSLAAEFADEAHLDAGECWGAGDQIDAVNVRDDRVAGGGAAREDVDEVDAERARRASSRRSRP